MPNSNYGDVSVVVDRDVALLEIHRPPHNYFDRRLLRDLADAFEALDQDPACRVLVLAAEGKSFCAGANFTGPGEGLSEGSGLYAEAARLFACAKPVVAAIQGATIGGGLGLALMADFRIVSPEARFSANFVKLGIHPGFGLTHTLPRLIGVQRAALLFYTGRRISANEALAWGLADLLVPAEKLRDSARAFAAEIAENAPLAVWATRATIRRGLVEIIRTQTTHELAEQNRLRQTDDHREGVRAVEERRLGRFTGQ